MIIVSLTARKFLPSEYVDHAKQLYHANTVATTHYIEPRVTEHEDVSDNGLYISTRIVNTSFLGDDAREFLANTHHFGEPKLRRTGKRMQVEYYGEETSWIALPIDHYAHILKYYDKKPVARMYYGEHFAFFTASISNIFAVYHRLKRIDAGEYRLTELEVVW